jgi:hypothetical protein
LAQWRSNAWITLNLPDGVDSGFRDFMAWKILATAVVVLTLGYCLLRLLPQGWTWRRRPVRQRTWPAFAFMLVMMTGWYAASVSPYRIPGMVDGLGPEYGILHVEKDGLQFRETYVGVWRDGRYSVTHTERRFFQYRFPVVGSFHKMPGEVRSKALALGESPELRELRGLRPAPLRRWRDDGWYLTGRQSGPVGFTKGMGTAPPPEVIEIFRLIEALPLTDTRTRDAKDVCLGFCYDPLAGLGFVYVNQRCRMDNQGKWQCF